MNTKDRHRRVVAFCPIPHPASRIPHPASPIPHPASRISHPPSRIPHPASPFPQFPRCILPPFPALFPLPSPSYELVLRSTRVSGPVRWMTTSSHAWSATAPSADTTLVWHSGMPDWVPFAQARAVPLAPRAALTGGASTAPVPGGHGRRQLTRRNVRSADESSPRTRSSGWRASTSARRASRC